MRHLKNKNIIIGLVLLIIVLFSLVVLFLILTNKNKVSVQVAPTPTPTMRVDKVALLNLQNISTNPNEIKVELILNGSGAKINVVETNLVFEGSKLKLENIEYINSWTATPSASTKENVSNGMISISAFIIDMPKTNESSLVRLSFTKLGTDAGRIKFSGDSSTYAPIGDNAYNVFLKSTELTL